MLGRNAEANAEMASTSGNRDLQNISLESSWEHVDRTSLASASCKSRESSSSRKNKKAARAKMHSRFGVGLRNLLSPKKDSSEKDPIRHASNSRPKQPPHSPPKSEQMKKVSIDREEPEPKSAPVMQPTKRVIHPGIQRVRLAASESEAGTSAADRNSRNRSSFSVGSGPSALKSSSGSPFSSSRDITGSKMHKRVLSNRGISIVSGEDFIMTSPNGKLKTALNSAWNNVKYGFNVKPRVKLSLKSPIWILGHCYTVGNIDHKEEKKLVYRDFLRDFHSRLWFTYRRDLPAFTGSTLTSDSGWGCMIRSGQMMLAQALLNHFLSRDWRWDESSSMSREKEVFHRQIVRWCGDGGGREQLFGLHRLVAVGQRCGKRAGDWYGPASIALILQKAMEMASMANPRLNDVRIYVSQDCTIYKGDVDKIRDSSTSARNAGEKDPAFIVLVAVRLGGNHINPIYIPCVKDLMTLRHSIGIIGGRPKHSLYFVGWQDEHFVQLDPHFCQPIIDTSSRTFPLGTYHCSEPRRLSIKHMDPSCTLGFYCRNREEYEEFVRIATEIQQKHCPDYPMFTFSEGSMADNEKDGLELQAFDAEAVCSSGEMCNDSTYSEMAELFDDYVVL